MPEKCRSLAGIVAPTAAGQLAAFRKAVDDALPGQISDIVLFGSRARRQSRRNSDYDVAVVVNDDVYRGTMERIVADTALPFVRAGYHIRPVIMLASLFRNPIGHPLTANVVRDGISIA